MLPKKVKVPKFPRTKKFSSVRQQTETLVKIAVLGAADVGKTCLIKSMFGAEFSDGHNQSLYNVYQTTVDCKYGKFVLEFTDISGRQTFPAMRTLAISRTDICILVYSLEDARSIEEISKLKEEILSIQGKIGRDIPLIMAGNKVDLLRKTNEQRNFNLREQHREQLADLESMSNSHVLTSAKTGRNVSNLLKSLTIECEALYLTGNDGITLNRQFSRHQNLIRSKSAT